MQLNRVQLVGVAILCFVAAMPIAAHLGDWAYGLLLDFVVSGRSDVEIVNFSVSSLAEGYFVFTFAVGVLCVLAAASFWLARKSPVGLIARTALLLGPMLAGMALYALYLRYEISRNVARLADLGTDGPGPPYPVSAKALHLEWVPLIGIILLALSVLTLRRLSAQRIAEPAAAEPVNQSTNT